MKRLTVFFIILIAAIPLGSCGSPGSDSPVSPDITPGLQTAAPSGNHNLLGVYDVILDTTSGDAEIIPVRDGSFHVNILGFLQNATPSKFSVGIQSANVPEGEFDVLISITHPFPLPKFMGFDMRVIIITPGTHVSAADSSIVYSGREEARLLNPDGYTRWWNPLEFTDQGLTGYIQSNMGHNGSLFSSTLHPFKFFADHLDATEEFNLPVDSRNEFTPTTNPKSRLFELKFPTVGGIPIVTFTYAVDVCWQDPGTLTPTLDDFPLSANMLEPYLITLDDNGSTAYYFPQGGYSGGDLNLKLGVHRHNGENSPNWFTNEITDIYLESETLFESVVHTDFSSGPVTTIDDAAYIDISIPNVTPDGLEGQEILVTVMSNRDTYHQDFPTAAPSAPIAAYDIFEAEIGYTPESPSINQVLVNRSVTGKLKGFTVTWTDVPGAVEYAIYWATDPYQFSGPVTYTSAPGSPVTGTSYTRTVPYSQIEGQWFIRVAARSFAGDPSSESEKSSPAFIDFEAFDDVLTSDLNQWKRRYNSIRNKFLLVNNTGIDSLDSLNLDQPNLPGFPALYRNAVTYCVSPELPAMPDASVCYIEFMHNRIIDLPVDYGYSACTSDILIQDPLIAQQPIYDDDGIDPFLPPDQVVFDFRIDIISFNSITNPAVPMNDLDIWGLDFAYNHPFNEPADPFCGWSGPVTSDFVMSRYDVPKVLTDEHPHAGICFAGNGGTNPPAYLPTGLPVGSYPLKIDEAALVIY